MTLGFGFSRIVWGAILLTTALTVADAQKIVIRKGAAGRVAAAERDDAGRRNDLAGDEYRIFRLINEQRTEKGLAELVWDARLAGLARDYSRKMAAESFFSHYDRDGNSVVERARDADLRDWSLIGENLFYCEGYDDFDELSVRGWMKSPDHRRNILDRQFNLTGIGAARSRGGRIYITQIFMKV